MPSYVPFALGLAGTGLAAFFGLTHHALRSYSRLRLEEALERKGRPDHLDRLAAHQDALLETTRSLHLLSLVAMVVLFQVWALEYFAGPAAGWLVGTAIAAVAAVVLGGVVPAAWANCSAESILAATLPLLQAVRAVFAPCRRLLDIFAVLVRRLAGVPENQETVSNIEEELVSVADVGEREGTLEEEQKDMIANVIKFKRTDASQIMTPRTDITSVDAAQPVDEARRLIAESGYSRIPATSGNLDTIVGILYAKDLLSPAPAEGAEPQRVGDVMRKPLFVPETKRLDELLRDFQANQVHIAVVLDEYGGTAGLVTIEDVVEEIVGEIVDEYEPEPAQPIRRVGRQAYQVEARVHIDELNEELDLDLPEHEDYETIGGFVLSRLGYIPKAGESLEQNGVTIAVLEADQRRILRLRIDVAETPGAAGEV
ncbi:MAG: hemolysin family protein [Phycisphaerae bacterium]